MPKAWAYSPTRLATYRRCPRKYYWQYVVKVPRKRTGEQSTGISVHSVLEAAQAAGGIARIGPDAAIALLGRLWESEGFKTPEDEAKARARAEAMIAAYAATPEAGGEAVMVEKKLTGTYDAVPLVGIVDRVDRRPDGSLELIDYKTGRRAAQGPDDATRLQLAVYRHLIAEAEGTAPAHVTVHHIEAGAMPLELAPAEWDAELAGAATTARAIEADEDFDACVARDCRWCDYADRCIPFQRAERSR